MPSIQVSDELYRKVERCAARRGFASVEAFVDYLLRKELATPLEQSRYFNPQRLAEIDRAAAQADAGK